MTKSRNFLEILEPIKIGKEYTFDPDNDKNIMDVNFPIVRKGKRITPGTKVYVLNVDFDSKHLLANITDDEGNIMTVHKISLTRI